MMDKNNYVVLCIDDEEMILESLSMELDGKLPNVELEMLQDGTEVSELVKELLQGGKKIAVTICDYIMPKQKGDEVLATIHKLSPNTKTVMLTGQSSFDGVTNAINRADLYRYISKPWDKDDFFLTIKSALESYIQQETIETQNRELRELNESLERKVIERTQELTKANEKLTEANRQIREYMGIIDKYVIISRINSKGDVIYASEAFCLKSGFAKDEIVGKNYWNTLYSHISEEKLKEIIGTVQNGGNWSGEIRHQSKDGGYYWVYEIITPNMKDESVILGFTSIRQDITDKKAVEEISITDELTGLYNRRYFNLIIEREINRASRDKEMLAFYMLDIDHFKLYNDTYGHVNGDTVLRKIGDLFEQMFKRGSDFCFRMGGEEFALLAKIKDENEAILIANLILNEVRNLKIIHENSATGEYISVSIGVHVINMDSDATPELIYQMADTKLYKAKNSGRNCYKV